MEYAIGVYLFTFNSLQLLVPPLRSILALWIDDFLLESAQASTKMKVMNEFWMQLGLCAEDLVYTRESRPLNEFGDTWEFVVYGEERCAQLGIEDDAAMADFLFQAFNGEVLLCTKNCLKKCKQAGFLSR